MHVVISWTGMNLQVALDVIKCLYENFRTLIQPPVPLDIFTLVCVYASGHGQLDIYYTE